MEMLLPQMLDKKSKKKPKKTPNNQTWSHALLTHPANLHRRMAYVPCRADNHSIHDGNGLWESGLC